MSQKVYIVVGWQGEYEDYEENPLKAFLDINKAKLLKEQAILRLEILRSGKFSDKPSEYFTEFDPRIFTKNGLGGYFLQGVELDA